MTARVARVSPWRLGQRAKWLITAEGAPIHGWCLTGTAEEVERFCQERSLSVEWVQR